MPKQETTALLSHPIAVGIFAVLALAAGIGSGMLLKSADADEFAAERATIEATSAEDKAALQEKLNRFAQLTEDEQQRLVRTSQRIQASPDTDALNATMLSYYEWVKSLDFYDRRALRDETLGVAERVSQVREVQVEEVSSRFLSRPDVALLCEWLRKYILVHVNDIPVEEYDWSRNRTLALAFIHWINKPAESEMPEPTAEMYSELAARLNIQRNAFESGASADESAVASRKDIVAGWIYNNLFTIRTGRNRGFRGPRITNIDMRDLLEFSISDRLSDETRAQLNNLDVIRHNRLATFYFLNDRDPEWWKETDSRRGGRGRGDGNRDGNRGDGNRNDDGEGGREEGGRRGGFGPDPNREDNRPRGNG